MLSIYVYIIYGFDALCYFFSLKTHLVIFIHSLSASPAFCSFIIILFIFLSTGSRGVAWAFSGGCGVDGEISPLLYFSISVCHQYISRILYIYINTTTDAAQRYFTARSFAHQAGQMSKKKRPFRISNGCVMLLKYHRTSNDAAGIWQDIVRPRLGWNIIDFNIFTMRCSSCTQSNCLAKINFIPTYYNDGGLSEYYYVCVIIMKYLKRYGSAKVQL